MPPHDKYVFLMSQRLFLEHDTSRHSGNEFLGIHTGRFIWVDMIENHVSPSGMPDNFLEVNLLIFAS
jgi:hypothetical protein